jgi:hypothetical protein
MDFYSSRLKSFLLLFATSLFLVAAILMLPEGDSAGFKLHPAHGGAILLGVLGVGWRLYRIAQPEQMFSLTDEGIVAAPGEPAIRWGDIGAVSFAADDGVRGTGVEIHVGTNPPVILYPKHSDIQAENLLKLIEYIREQKTGTGKKSEQHVPLRPEKEVMSDAPAATPSDKAPAFAVYIVMALAALLVVIVASIFIG